MELGELLTLCLYLLSIVVGDANESYISCLLICFCCWRCQRDVSLKYFQTLVWTLTGRGGERLV